MRKLTIEQMRQLASQRDGKCLSVVYESNYTDLEWECKNGHRWFALPKAVKQGHWCTRCVVNSRKKSIEDMQVLAQKKGGKCLSTQYGMNKTKLLWECKKGHQWHATPIAIQRGGWCPVCSGRAPLALHQMQVLASQKNGKFLSKTYTRTSDLHRWQCAQGHTFQMRPHHVRRGSWCPHCAGKVVTYNDMVQMAQRKGGKFLSQEYRGTAVKHDWECCEGHQWKTTPNSIQSGTWCPFCADRRPYTLEDLREFAKTHDGQCLATEYVNSKTQVLWQCNQAHQWWVAFHDIKKRKAWCPICAMAGKG